MIVMSWARIVVAEVILVPERVRHHAMSAPEHGAARMSMVLITDAEVLMTHLVADALWLEPVALFERDHPV